MRHISILTLLFLIISPLITNGQQKNDTNILVEGATYSENGDFFLNGNKIGNIKKTSKGSMLTSSMPDFTIYDVNGVPRILLNGNEKKLIFLDDNESYISNQTSLFQKQIALFFAKDSILTKDGYNVAFKSRFIKKYDGYNASNKTPRDYSAEVTVNFLKSSILQGSTPIGSFTSGKLNSSKESYVIRNMQKKVVAVFYTEQKNGMCSMEIYDGSNTKSLTKFNQEPIASQYMVKGGVEWLVKNKLL